MLLCRDGELRYIPTPVHKQIPTKFGKFGLDYFTSLQGDQEYDVLDFLRYSNYYGQEQEYG